MLLACSKNICGSGKHCSLCATILCWTESPEIMLWAFCPTENLHREKAVCAKNYFWNWQSLFALCNNFVLNRKPRDRALGFLYNRKFTQRKSSLCLEIFVEVAMTVRSVQQCYVEQKAQRSCSGLSVQLKINTEKKQFQLQIFVMVAKTVCFVQQFCVEQKAQRLCSGLSVQLKIDTEKKQFVLKKYL